MNRYFGNSWFQFQRVVGAFENERILESYIQEKEKLIERLDEVLGKDNYSIFEANDLLDLSRNIKLHIQKSL